MFIVRLQGLDHRCAHRGDYLQYIADCVTIEVTIRNPVGQQVAYRKGCVKDGNILNLEQDLGKFFPDNLTDVLLHSPWRRVWPADIPWPSEDEDTISRKDLTRTSASNLLSHIHELLLFAAQYFVLKRTLTGNLWTSDFYLQTGLSELQETNRSRLRDPGSFYINLGRNFARFEAPTVTLSPPDFHGRKRDVDPSGDV